MSRSALKRVLASRKLTGDEIVWRPGMQGWSDVSVIGAPPPGLGAESVIAHQVGEHNVTTSLLPDAVGLQIRVYNTAAEMSADVTGKAAKHDWHVRGLQCAKAGAVRGTKVKEHGFPLSLLVVNPETPSNLTEQIVAFDSEAELHDWNDRLLRQLVRFLPSVQCAAGVSSLGLYACFLLLFLFCFSYCFCLLFRFCLID